MKATRLRQTTTIILINHIFKICTNIYIYIHMHIKTYHYTTDCRREALLPSCSPQNAVTAITAKIKIVWRMSSPRSNLRRQKRYWSGGAAANILETHHVYLPEGQIRRDWRATLQMPTPVGKTMGPSLWSKKVNHIKPHRNAELQWINNTNSINWTPRRIAATICHDELERRFVGPCCCLAAEQSL